MSTTENEHETVLKNDARPLPAAHSVDTASDTILKADGSVPPGPRAEGVADTGALPPRVSPGRASVAGAPQDPLIGLLLANRYRIEERLGVGGMGSVYRALHVHMKKRVALKVLHPSMMHVAEAVARFEREAVAAGRIEHPNVAKATDFGRLHDGSFYLALEFVEGVSLRQLLHNTGPLPLPRAVNIMRQIAEALNAAHEQGVVHRDLKPENVMLVAKGQDGRGQDVVKVLDFGIAKVSATDPLPGENQLTKAGAVFGTPDYMSPEQVGGTEVDARSDLYALGILSYELLAGNPPFQGDSIAVVLMKHLTETAAPLPAHIDWRVADLIHRLLAKDPAARPASARHVSDELIRLRLSVVPERPPRNFADAIFTRVKHTVERWDLLPRLRHLLRPVTTLLLRLALRWPILGRGIKVGNAQLTLGALLFAASCLLSMIGLLALFGVFRSAPAPEVAIVTAPNEAPAAPLPVVSAPPIARAVRGPELEALIAMPVYKRKVADWLRLAQLHGEIKEWSESTAAYRNALQLDRTLAKDNKLLQTFRNLAFQRESSEAASNIAVNLLGEPGLDLLYDLWLAVKDDKKQRVLSDALYKQLEIHHSRRASKALKVRLDLEFAAGLECPQVQKIVKTAIKSADERSVAALQALENTHGCGFDKQQDCYPCLRESGDLEAALTTAREVPGPRFDGSQYVPGR